ncbi:TonB-dependent receptor [Sphingosinicella microcystinivorans]|uniref:TonB-dependent receptor n=1 Tax=Sphingosinicella microcystinivorans TaxID=335406 RepID=UPI0022F3AB46|nr:TonB-dependent receptor [Sphingosinicella microcystinivorans]WBX85157.1 TonB-dependent receptor [Sphingosinicella microcystinivorans]
MAATMTHSKRLKTGLLLFAGLGALGIASAPALAGEEQPERSGQGSESQGIGEIIVTAQRRAERDIDVPLSITAFNADDVRNANASYLTDLGTRVPGINISQSPGTGAPTIAIRGVSSASNGNPGFPPAIGVYVDDVYQGRDPTFNTILNDIERIEVLRGPQGTLYGKNTIGGAINIITRDPGNDAEIGGDLTYGNLDYFQIRASAGGALVPDQLMVRVSGVHRERGGFIRNTLTGKDANGLNADGGRIVVLSKIAENVRLRLSADYFTEEGRTALETGPVTLPAIARFADILPQDPEDNIVQLDAPDFARREVYGFAGRLDIDLGPAALTSITAYRRYNSNFNYDSDGLPIDGFDVGREENGKNFSQELRLASTGDDALTWLLGFYYYEDETYNLRRLHYGTDIPFLIAGAAAPVVFPGYAGERSLTESTIDGRSYAFFGSATYKLTERLKLSAGLRYTHESKDFTYEQGITEQYTGGPVSVVAGSVVNIPLRHEKYSDGRLTGDASLSFDIVPDVVSYLRYSRGFKAGGFQTDVVSPPFNPSESLGFDPETVDSYELGLKALLFNRRARLNLAVFHMDWSGKQEQIYTGFSFLIRNAATAKSTGAELELSAQLAEGLNVNGNISYLDTRYSSFPGNALDKQNFPNLPKWSGAAGIQYQTPISSKLELFARGDLIHRGSTYNLPNASVRIEIPTITTFDGRFGVQSADGTWGLYAWGRNLSNENALGRGLNFPLGPSNITTRAATIGRTYGLELRFNY